MKTLPAIIESGVARPLEQMDLLERSRVEVAVLPPAGQSTA
jgi:hypothetical protein